MFFKDVFSSHFLHIFYYVVYVRVLLGGKVKVKKNLNFLDFILNLIKYTYYKAPGCVIKTELRPLSIMTYTDSEKLVMFSFKLRKKCNV